MKKTYRQLQKDLADVKITANKWQEDYYDQRSKVSELQEKLEGRNKLEISGLMEKNYHNEAENKRLTEIIRWLIKPSTAELEKLAEIESIKKNRGF